MSNTQADIQRICDSIKSLLLEKTAKYGDSALEPVRCMSKSSPVEQILVRIDDNLSRISRCAGLVGDDEDVFTDLFGYFVLLKIALERQDQKVISDSAERILLTEDQYSAQAAEQASIPYMREYHDDILLWDETTGPTIRHPPTSVVN